MPWYTFAFTRAGLDHGEHENLIQATETVWDSNGKPPDFALFGTHKFKASEGILTLYYLFSPSVPKYCPDGFFIRWQPNEVTERKPSREGLEVMVGAAEALQLLD